MSRQARIVIVTLSVVSLIFTGAVVSAQRQMTPLGAPTVVSGRDIGFRVEGHIGNRPAGTLVIRVNGEWVVPVASSGPARLSDNR